MAKITDIIYASQWTVKTEEAVKSMTLAQLKSFILNNSEVEEDEDEESWIHVDKVNLYGKTYMLTGEGYGKDEFFISNDGRVFFLISLRHRVEIVDEPENNEEAQEPEQDHEEGQAMTTMNYLKLGFCVEGEPAERHLRTDGEQLRIDIEWLGHTADELIKDYGPDWKQQYIAACEAAGIELLYR